MNSRIHWMKALWVVIALRGVLGMAHAAQAPQTPATLNIENLKLSQAIKMLTVSNPDAQVVFVDPEGKLASKVVPFIQIQANGNPTF